MPDESLTYRDAGVDIDEAYRALRSASADIESTFNENVVGGVGAFGGLFHASFPGVEHPVLVSSIDGVGTKTKVARMLGSYLGLGWDIVNHCVNDILCQGARPLFFLDYFGASKLSGLVLEEVLKGAAAACREASCVLIGGETAEMPGIYEGDEFDLVGAIVGVVDFDKRLPKVALPGDAIVGIASDGLHTNGFSLARRALFELGSLKHDSRVPGSHETVGQALLRPHRSYLKALRPLLQEDMGIRGLAHITGGGLLDNVPRALPADVRAIIDRTAWTPPPIFTLIQSVGSVPDAEMFRTFNMGIGMAVIADSEAAPEIVRRLSEAGESAAVIGRVQHGPHDVQIV